MHCTAQVLQLIVYDEDMAGLKDKVIGVALMPLQQVRGPLCSTARLLHIAA